MGNTEQNILSAEKIEEIFRDPAYKPCEASYYSKKRIYEFAEQAHRQVMHSDTGKFSLPKLLELIGAKVHYFTMNEFDQISGSIIVESIHEVYILLSNYTSEVRDRFTTAHEVGHYVLHCPEAAEGQKYTDDRFGTGRVEQEANWFAAGLLVPTMKLREYIDGDGSTDPYTVATHFQVSGRAAEIRINTFLTHDF